MYMDEAGFCGALPNWPQGRRLLDGIVGLEGVEYKDLALRMQQEVAWGYYLYVSGY